MPEFAAATSPGSRAVVLRVTATRWLILLAAALSFALSVVLWFGGHELQGIFVGLCVPSAALSLLVWGAILDRRDEQARLAASGEEERTRAPDLRVVN